MSDTIITSNKNKSLKFIASIFIILTHIFSKKGIDNTLMYTPLFYLVNRPVESYIDSFTGICVGIFTFLSGYGLYIKSRDSITYKEIWGRINKLYINYWIITIIFFSIGKYMGVYKFEIKHFILNLLALNTSYNHPAWFLRLYVMLLITYPIIIKVLKFYNVKMIIILSFIINIIGMAMTKLCYVFGINSIIINLIVEFLGGQFLFILGVVVSKYCIFNRITKKLGDNKLVYYGIFLITTLCIMITIDIPVIGEILKLILIPIFIFSLTNIISENAFIYKLGKHSTNIWLVHAFFYDYLFSDIIYSVKYSPLIFIFLLILCLISSCIINLIYRLIIRTNISPKTSLNV